MSKERRNKHYSNRRHQLARFRKRDREWMLEAKRKLEGDSLGNDNSFPGSVPMKPGQEYDIS